MTAIQPRSETRLALPPSPPDLDSPDLVDRAAALKRTIEGLTEELKRLNLILAERAEYRPDRRVGRLSGRRFRAEVRPRELVKWDQNYLNEARRLMGDEEFFRIFKWEFKPLSEKRFSGALLFGAHGRLLEKARLTSPGAPSVTFTEIEGPEASAPACAPPPPAV